MVADPPEDQLSDNCTCESDGVDVTLRRGVRVVRLVEGLQNGVDLANDAVSDSGLASFLHT